MKKFLSVVLAFLMLAVMLPTTALAAGKPVKVGKTEYESLKAAIDAAEPVNGVITYEIYGKAEISGSDQWISFVRNGQSVTAVKFVGVGDNAEISITSSQSILGVQSMDIDVSFENLILSHPIGAFVSDLGNATNYFACMVRNENHTVTYTNCTFPNGVCNNQYGKTVFNSCKFTSTSGWSLWNTSTGTSELNNCSFTGKRGIKLYAEGTYGVAGSVTITNTTFDLNDNGKAAVEITKPGSVTLTNVSVTGITAGVMKKNLDDGYKSDGIKAVTIAATGSGISGSFTVPSGDVVSGKGDAADKTEFSITSGTFTGNTDSVKDYLPEGKTINSNGAVVDKGATPPTDGTITIIVPSTEETPKTDDQKNPSTGANDMVAAAAALMAVAALGMSILSRKK